MDDTKNIIEAYPTKDFFISMLVRDISTNDAINDLIDNCIDGAKRLKGNNEDVNYNDLYIDIVISSDRFVIKDNCGGIPLEIAKKYAFRFGRPVGMVKTDWSIGQFGIGMKRALFKLGHNFSVTSKTNEAKFTMSVDANEWKETEGWEFEFDEVIQDSSKLEKLESGTTIEVTNLKNEISNLFGESNFLKTLKSEIELKNLYNLHKGISIRFNNIKLKSKQLNLQVSDDFSIAEWSNSFNNESIKVRLLVGMGESNSKLGGWYIFCNDRLIVGHEQTELTGWTGKGGDGVAHFHSQFDRFRGFAFFEAIDSSLLPWNTTKTGMNRDSPIFIAVRRKMIEMMKPFMSFSNALKKENESSFKGERVLHEKLKTTETINLSVKSNNKINEYVSEKFKYPVKKKDIVIEPNEGKIIYTVSKEHIKKMKKYFNVTSQNEAGKKAFEYVYNSEIKDNVDYE